MIEQQRFQSRSRVLAMVTSGVLMLLLTVAQAKDMEDKMAPWFTNKNCQKVELIKYQSISDSKIIKSVVIQDSNYVTSLIRRIEQVPAGGEMMVSFGPKAQHSELVFYCDNQKQVIEIYNKGFKTPSTGFNSIQGEVEKSLIRDLAALLEPDFQKMIPKIKNLEIPFGVFTVTFQGTVEDNSAPVSVSFSTEKYLIKSQKGSERALSVTSGQLPPPPVKFELEGGFLDFLFPSKFKLLTYDTVDGVRMFPDYFQITK